MKKLLPFFLVLIGLGSCNVSKTVTVDSIANAEVLKGYQNFKLVQEDYSDKRNERIKLSFRNKLLDYGFVESLENPDFLVQGVVVTRKFIQEFGHYSSIPGTFYSESNSGNNSPSGGAKTWAVNQGMIGKVIFLIQDAKTNEIAWMGVSTGIISGSGMLEAEDLDLALHELMASL
jgi:hypothetical protein